MVEEVNKTNKRPRIASERAKGAKLIATSYYANIEGKDFASVLYNGEVVFTTDKEGNKLNLLGDVISKDQIAAENARTAKLNDYLARKELRDGKEEKIAEGDFEHIQLSNEARAKIVQMDRAQPTTKDILMRSKARTA